MTDRAPWFCPSCQKHHGPHVDTCPGGGGGIGAQPPILTIPFIQPVPPSYPPTPWVPYDPSMCTTTVVPYPNTWMQNATFSNTTAVQ
jgi:hypothetical protein